MERSSQLMLLATCLYALSCVEYTPAFMTPIQASPQTGSLRGTASGAAQEETAGKTYSMSTSLRTAAALVAVSAASMSCRAKAGSRTARKADLGGGLLMESTGGSKKLADALYLTAMKKKEAVPVAQDMMRIRDQIAADPMGQLVPEEIMFDCDLKDPKTGETNKPSLSLEELYGPFQSTIVLPFIKYVEHKGMYQYLGPIAQYYTQILYANQDIAPVRVVTASPLTSDQQDKIVTKMKGLTGATDIKLSNKIDKGIVSGLKIEYDFQDADAMRLPEMIIDMSMTKVIKDEALANAGVVLGGR